jgi:ABC-type lipoprotein release transport system permease subunit
MLQRGREQRDNRGVGPVIARLRSELRSQWRAWTGVALLIGFGGGVVLTTAAGARRTATAYDRFLRASHAADLLVSPDETGFPDLYPQLARATHANVTPVIGFGAAPSAHLDEPVLIAASPDRSWLTRVERPKVSAGRMLRPGAADEVFADTTAARVLHLQVGSRLALTIANRNEELPDPAHDKTVTVHVVGIGATRDSIAPVNALATAPTLGAGPAFAHQFGPDNYAFDGAYVTLRPGTTMAAFTTVAQRLARSIPATGGQVAIADEAEQAAQVDHAIRPQAVALALFALLTALTALLAITQVLARRLFLSAGENDALQALGMRRRQLLLVALAEVAAVATLGAGIAFAIAVAASPTMPIGPARLAEPHPGVALDWAVLGLGCIAIVALLVAVMVVPAWRLTRGTSQQEVRRVRGAPRPSTATRWAAAAGTPPATAIGIGYAVDAGGGRTSVPTRGVILVTALAVAAIAATATFGSNLSRLVGTPRLYGQSWDVTVDAQFSPIPMGRVDALLRRQAGVQAWTFGTHADVTIAGRIVPGVALVAKPDTRVAPTVVAGRSAGGPDEIALGSKTLAALHRRVGDFVTAALPQPGPNAPPAKRLRIVGRAVFPFLGEGSFTPTGLGVGAEVTEDALGGHGQAPINFVLIRTVSGHDHAAAIRRVRAAFERAHLCGPYNQCAISTTIRPTDVLNYARIRNTPVALAAVLAILAVGVLANLLVSSIRRRRRDLAILKTLGFRRRQISAAVAWQASTVVVLALLIGLPLGTVAGRWVWSTFASNLGIPGDAHVPVLFFLVMIPTALVIGNLIAAAPGVLASRLPASEVLRSE